MSKPKLHFGDCLDIMKTIPDGSVDLILQDPPYNTTNCRFEWDIMTKIDEFWSEWNRIIKPNGAIVMFGSEPFSSKLRLSNLDMYKYDWIWHKNLSGGFVMAKKRPMKYHENILVFFQKQPTYNPQFEEYSDSVKKMYAKNNATNVNKAIKNNYHNEVQNIKKVKCQVELKRGKYPSTVQFFKRPHTANGKSLHPTQKPTSLLEYLIKTYTNENETVFDGFAGSGSTLIACMNTNRNGIGVELDKKYYELAKDRIDTHKIRGSLFD